MQQLIVGGQQHAIPTTWANCCSNLCLDISAVAKTFLVLQDDFKQAIALAVQNNKALQHADLTDRQVRRAKLEELKRLVE